jgi:hypothetical protein
MTHKKQTTQPPGSTKVIELIKQKFKIQLAPFSGA